MIGPLNSQFSGNYLALCMALQTGLSCNAALAGLYIFHCSQRSAWYKLGAVECSIGKQSLGDQTTEQVVDEKSLTSVKLQSVIEHSSLYFLFCFFFFFTHLK